jgi:molecular chaperone DnaJ
MAKDYYKLLGVAKGASSEEIKKAYRKLAHEHHPDKKGGNEAKFKEINEAYQVLGDQKKRENYDRFGTAEPGGFGGGPGGGGFGGFQWAQGGQGGFDGMDMGDLGDIFETFFGGGMGGQQRRRTVTHGSDLETGQEISLEEAYHGVKKNISIRTFVSCVTCKGQGGDLDAGTETCSACDGKGEVREEKRTFFGSFSQVRACERCHGSGKIPKKMCATCKGSGRVAGERKAELEINPGIADGQIIQIKGFGEAGERGAAAGDLYVRVRVRKHPSFERRGDDLVSKHELNVFDLLLGRKLNVKTLDDKIIEVDVPAHFNLKENLRVPGKGMPHFRNFGHGDLLVEFILKAPKKLTGKEKKTLEELEKEL